MGDRYSWSQAICDPCWESRNPVRVPVRLKQPEVEDCAYCGESTTSGIYVRDDPANVNFPRLKDD